jgi:hypothetical protein
MEVQILSEVDNTLAENGLEEVEILGLDEVSCRLELVPVELSIPLMSERETEVIEMLLCLELQILHLCLC